MATPEDIKVVDENTDTRRPVTVRVEQVTVRILPTIKSGRPYWLVEDYSSGKRRLLNAKSLPAARAKAKVVAEAVAQNKQAVRDIDQLDLLAFSRAKDIAAPYKQEVDEAVRQWAEAVFLLKGKGSLLDAVKFYIEHGGPELTPCRVSAAVKELLALKEAQGLSGGQQAAVKSRLNRFAEVFGERELHSLTVKEVENFILGLNVGGIARNHFRATLGNLFVFAQSRRYVPKDCNPAKEVRRAKVEDSEVAHFTPEQMKKLLAACKGGVANHLSLLLLCGFAGLRPSEAARVTWQMVGEDFIRLPGRATKTRKARLIPIQDNLKAWLAPLRQKAGLVVPDSVNEAKAPAILTGASGVAWVKDGLRHAFGTYRQAIVRNVGQVADEMGNTIPVCKKHYVNPLVTADEAQAWFAIKPEGAEKIAPMPQASGQ